MTFKIINRVPISGCEGEIREKRLHMKDKALFHKDNGPCHSLFARFSTQRLLPASRSKKNVVGKSLENEDVIAET